MQDGATTATMKRPAHRVRPSSFPGPEVFHEHRRQRRCRETKPAVRRG